jgi:anti-anti-sigma factor
MMGIEERERPETEPSSNHQPGESTWRTLAAFEVASASGNERLAMELTAQAVQALNLPPVRIERLKTAVAEATMNAIEHGNHYHPELNVRIVIQASAQALRVRISDHGGKQVIPEPVPPDLDAKLSGVQSPRGWGLFLIEKMVDEIHTFIDGESHTLELVVYLKEKTLMKSQPFEAKVRFQLDRAILDLSGEINAFAESALNAAYAEADQSHPAMILFNFSQVTYINSTGIALIVSLLAKARKNHRQLAIYGLSDHYVEIFQITRLSDFMSIYTDEESALLQG